MVPPETPRLFPPPRRLSPRRTTEGARRQNRSVLAARAATVHGPDPSPCTFVVRTFAGFPPENPGTGLRKTASDMLPALKGRGSQFPGRFLFQRDCPWGLSPALLSLGAFTGAEHPEPANPTGLNVSPRA